MGFNNFRKELKKAKLKITPARIAIMSLLGKTREPIDVNTIISKTNHKGVKIDPATVFRIMHALVKKGIVIPIQLQEGKMRYELANKKHHHHLICEICGRIEDILISVIPTLEKKIQKKQGFLIKRHALEFFGICKNCQS